MPDLVSKIIASLIGKAAWESFKSLFPNTDKIYDDWMNAVASTDTWFTNVYGDQYGSRNNRFYDFNDIHEIIFRSCFFGDDAKEQEIAEMSKRSNCPTPVSVIAEYIKRLRNALASDQAYNWLFKEFEHYRLNERSAADLRELSNLFKEFYEQRQVPFDRERIVNLNSYAKFIRDEYLILVDSLWEPDQETPRQIGLFDVYVTRDEEGEIINNIEEDLTDEVKKWIPITGDAGFGKTTLLFSLWNHFDNNKDETGIVPIFIRSSDLFENDNVLKAYAEISHSIDEASIQSSFSNNQRILHATIQKIYSEKKKCIVFIDTLDAILTTKERILQIRNLKDQLADIGATLVITCRDFEFDALRHLPRGRFFRLKNYSDARELPLALERYIDAFYQNRPFKWKEQQKADLLEAVASRVLEDRDLAYVCRNPLTLKMLFLIYHPDQIPQNIDIRLLYNEFWNAKVLCDAERRPFGKGDYLIPIASALQKDEFACRIAFEMLVKGRLSLTLSELRPLLSSYHNVADLLKGLLSENVLKEGGGFVGAESNSAKRAQGKIEFFHQTLYEYAAARFLRHLKPENRERIIDWMLQHIIENPWDKFRIPVVEQIALQFPEYQKKIMNFLLDSGSAIHAKLAVSIWSRLRSEERGNEYTPKVLNNTQSVRKFILQSIRDFPSFRQDEVVYIFHEVWAKGDHNLKENVLGICIEMCNKRADAVHQFLKDDAVWQYLTQLTDRSVLGGTISRLIVPMLTQLMEIYPQWVFAKLEFILEILLFRKLLDVNLTNLIDLLYDGIYTKHDVRNQKQVFEFEPVISLMMPLINERLPVEAKRKIGKIYAEFPQSLLRAMRESLFEMLAGEHPQRAVAAANIILEIITSSKIEEVRDDYFSTLWELFTRTLPQKNSVCTYIISDVVLSGLAASGNRKLWDNLISLLPLNYISKLQILALIFSRFETALSNHVDFWIDSLEQVGEAPEGAHRALQQNIFAIIGNSYLIDPLRVKTFLIEKAKSTNDVTSAMALKELSRVAGLDYEQTELIKELSNRSNDDVKKALIRYLERAYRNGEFENNKELQETIAQIMLSIADPSNTSKTEVLKQCIPSMLLLASSSSVYHKKILEIAYVYGKSSKSDIRKSGALLISTLLGMTESDAKRETYLRLLFELYDIGDVNNKVFLLRFLNESLAKYHTRNDVDRVIKKCRELISTEVDTGIFASICSIMRTFANDAPDEIARLVVAIILRIDEIKLTKEPAKHIRYLLVRIFISQMQMENIHILTHLKPHLGENIEILEQFLCEVVGKYYPNNHILPLSELIRRDDLLPRTKEKIHALVSKSTQSDKYLDVLYEISGIEKV